MKKSVIHILLIVLFLSCKEDTSPLSNDQIDSINPSISILYPLNKSIINQDTIITIIVDASDNKGIREVEFIIDGEKEYADDNLPYNYLWDGGGKFGIHSLRARAYDLSNNFLDSQTSTFTINSFICSLGLGK